MFSPLLDLDLPVSVRVNTLGAFGFSRAAATRIAARTFDFAAVAIKTAIGHINIILAQETKEIAGHTLMNSAGVSKVGRPTHPQKLENRLSTLYGYFWAFSLL